jgi:Phenylacetic acid-responsive transcriptional repressor
MNQKSILILAYRDLKIRPVKSKTLELLSFLLWSAEQLTRPTVRNLTDSFESWTYRNGLLQELASLEKQQLLERVSADSGDRLYRLTSQGRLAALGGRDPEAEWSRSWDGRWRLVIFDVPMARNAHRQRLRRYLRERGFGFLQKSVWITPDPLKQERELLAGAKTDVTSLFILEGKPCAGESNTEIISAAWDFERINLGYSRHLQILARQPEGSINDATSAKSLHQWAAEEREAWLSAVSSDPLLPKRLLPDGYLGTEAWRKRVAVLARARKRLDTFDSLAMDT